MMFKVQIGDVVANSLHVMEIDKFLEDEDTAIPMRPDSLRGEKRISVECAGGTQLFYGGRTMFGEVQKHAESNLVPVDVLWDAWLTGIHRQEARRKP